MVIKKVSHSDQSCGVHPKPFGNVVGSPAVHATDSVEDLGGGGGGGGGSYDPLSLTSQS